MNLLMGMKYLTLEEKNHIMVLQFYLKYQLKENSFDLWCGIK